MWVLAVVAFWRSGAGGWGRDGVPGHTAPGADVAHVADQGVAPAAGIGGLGADHAGYVSAGIHAAGGASSGDGVAALLAQLLPLPIRATG